MCLLSYNTIASVGYANPLSSTLTYDHFEVYSSPFCCILWGLALLDNTSWGGRPPRYATAQACKWWNDIRHVRIWIGHHYCMSMLACLYNQPKWPGDLDFWPFDLESGIRVTCDLGYLCANFGLPTPLCSRLRPDVRDRQTDVRQTDRQTDIPRLLEAGA